MFHQPMKESTTIKYTGGARSGKGEGIFQRPNRIAEYQKLFQVS